jgi:hypothetical protein
VVKTTNDAVAQTIAQGMAAQIIDEVLGARYCAVESSPYDSALGPSNAEQSGKGRELFDDTDDYNDYTAQPPEDPSGQTLGLGDGVGNLRHPAFRISGDKFANWRQRIDVYYVNPSDPTVRRTDNQGTDYRAVEVTIERIEPNGSIRPLATLRRVYCYVPIP